MPSPTPVDFYAYLYLREDGSPFYAGKGTGDRAFRSCHRHRPPKDKSRIMLLPMISEEEALEYEKRLIALFGRKDNGTGCLRNLSDGGEGTAGYIHSPNARQRITLSLKDNKRASGHKHSQEWKQKSSERLKGHQFWGLASHTDETKEKMSKSNSGEKNGFYGKKHSPDTRKRISENRRGIEVSQETRNKLSLAAKAVRDTRKVA